MDNRHQQIVLGNDKELAFFQSDYFFWSNVYSGITNSDYQDPLDGFVVHPTNTGRLYDDTVNENDKEKVIVDGLPLVSHIPRGSYYRLHSMDFPKKYTLKTSRILPRNFSVFITPVDKMVENMNQFIRRDKQKMKFLYTSTGYDLQNQRTAAKVLHHYPTHVSTSTHVNQTGAQLQKFDDFFSLYFAPRHVPSVAAQDPFYMSDVHPNETYFNNSHNKHNPVHLPCQWILIIVDRHTDYYRGYAGYASPAHTVFEPLLDMTKPATEFDFVFYLGFTGKKNIGPSFLDLKTQFDDTTMWHDQPHLLRLMDPVKVRMWFAMPAASDRAKLLVNGRHVWGYLKRTTTTWSISELYVNHYEKNATVLKIIAKAKKEVIMRSRYQEKAAQGSYTERHTLDTADKVLDAVAKTGGSHGTSMGIDDMQFQVQSFNDRGDMDPITALDNDDNEDVKRVFERRGATSLYDHITAGAHLEQQVKEELNFVVHGDTHGTSLQSGLNGAEFDESPLLTTTLEVDQRRFQDELSAIRNAVNRLVSSRLDTITVTRNDNTQLMIALIKEESDDVYDLNTKKYIQIFSVSHTDDDDNDDTVTQRIPIQNAADAENAILSLLFENGAVSYSVQSELGGGITTRHISNGVRRLVAASQQQQDHLMDDVDTKSDALARVGISIDAEMARLRASDQEQQQDDNEILAEVVRNGDIVTDVSLWMRDDEVNFPASASSVSDLAETKQRLEMLPLSHAVRQRLFEQAEVLENVFALTYNMVRNGDIRSTSTLWQSLDEFNTRLPTLWEDIKRGVPIGDNLFNDCVTPFYVRTVVPSACGTHSASFSQRTTS